MEISLLFSCTQESVNKRDLVGDWEMETSAWVQDWFQLLHLALFVLSPLWTKLEGIIWCLCSGSLAERECVWLQLGSRYSHNPLGFFKTSSAESITCSTVCYTTIGERRQLPSEGNPYFLRNSHEVIFQVFFLPDKNNLGFSPFFKCVHSGFCYFKICKTKLHNKVSN